MAWLTMMAQIHRRLAWQFSINVCKLLPCYDCCVRTSLCLAMLADVSASYRERYLETNSISAFSQQKQFCDVSLTCKWWAHMTWFSVLFVTFYLALSSPVSMLMPSDVIGARRYELRTFHLAILEDA